MDEPQVQHVYPVDDLVAHELVGTVCICGPAIEAVDVGEYWPCLIVIHHSLDGRAAMNEQRRAVERAGRRNEGCTNCPEDDLLETAGMVIDTALDMLVERELYIEGAISEKPIPIVSPNAWFEGAKALATKLRADDG